MVEVNNAFVQQILHISKRKWKPNVKHNPQADDRGSFRSNEKAGRNAFKLNISIQSMRCRMTTPSPC